MNEEHQRDLRALQALSDRALQERVRDAQEESSRGVGVPLFSAEAQVRQALQPLYHLHLQTQRRMEEGLRSPQTRKTLGIRPPGATALPGIAWAASSASRVIDALVSPTLLDPAFNNTYYIVVDDKCVYATLAYEGKVHLYRLLRDPLWGPGAWQKIYTWSFAKKVGTILLHPCLLALGGGDIAIAFVAKNPRSGLQLIYFCLWEGADYPILSPTEPGRLVLASEKVVGRYQHVGCERPALAYNQKYDTLHLVYSALPDTAKTDTTESSTSWIYHARIRTSELRRALLLPGEPPQWEYTKVSELDDYDAILPTIAVQRELLLVAWKYNFHVDPAVASNSRVVVAVREAALEEAETKTEKGLTSFVWSWVDEKYIAGNPDNSSSPPDPIGTGDIGPGDDATSAHDPALLISGGKVYLAYEQGLDVFIVESNTSSIQWSLGNTINSSDGSLSASAPNTGTLTSPSTPFFPEVTRHRFVHLAGNDAHVVAIWTGTYTGRARDAATGELGVPTRIDCYGSLYKTPVIFTLSGWTPLENSGNPSGTPASLPDIPDPPYVADLSGIVLQAGTDSGGSSGVLLCNVEKLDSLGASLSTSVDLTRNPYLILSTQTDTGGATPTTQTLLGLYRVENSFVAAGGFEALGEMMDVDLSNLDLVPAGVGTYLPFGATSGDSVEGTLYDDYFSTNRPGVAVHSDGTIYFVYLKINQMEEDDWGEDTVIEFCCQIGVLL